MLARRVRKMRIFLGDFPVGFPWREKKEQGG
jgi:hypothetical protein